MISRRGLKATSIRDVAVHSRSPLGSTYHYFPGGKQQLVTEAVQFTGETIVRMLTSALQAGPVEGLRAFLALFRQVIVSSDFRAGCAVLAVSIEEGPAEEILPALDAASGVFRSWELLLADSLRNHGAHEEQAEQIATLIIAAVEGSVAMCRAKRSAQPLDNVAAQLEALIKTAIRD